MYRLRLWSTRHARGLETLYQAFERVMVVADPLWRRLGYERLERPVAAIERRVKGLLFDCQMCGQCALSETGMSCPMNCPKAMRNGPCGGVRADGHCEVVPTMRCVWVEAWEGSRRMRSGRAAIRALRPAVDRRLIGTSAWLRAARLKAGGRR
jgi:methylene-tetrahydrofolate reductase-like protein